MKKQETTLDNATPVAIETQDEQAESLSEDPQEPASSPDQIAKTTGNETKDKQADSPGEDVQKRALSPYQIAQTTGNEDTEELEKRKLRLELLDLAKPWWRRTQSIATMVALVAVITTAIFSNLDAKLALLKLRDEIAELEEDKKSLKQTIEQLNHQKVTLFNSLKQKSAQVDPATSRKINGRVINEITDLPIPGVVIEATASDEDLGVVRVVTDAKGEFFLSVLDVSQLRVTATKPGFVPFPFVRDLPLDKEEVSILIRLISTSPLQERVPGND